jgi:hypothetical protein
MSRLLFVGGFPSGGTDLLKTVLSAHPDISISGEMPQLVDLLKLGYDCRSRFSSPTKIEQLKLDLSKLDRWKNMSGFDRKISPQEYSIPLSLQAVVERLVFDRSYAVVGNKTPQNTENILKLHRLFPTAHFLIVVRDVRDVCLSWRNKWGKDVYWCAAKWAERMALGKNHSYKLPGKQCAFIRFEDFLVSPETTGREICRFLDLPYSTRMLEHHKYIDKKVDGKINYGQAIKADNQQKWKKALPPSCITRIEEIAYQTMIEFGYQPEFATRAVPISKLAMGRGMLADSLAMIAVGNRAKKANNLSGRLSNLLYALKERIDK